MKHNEIPGMLGTVLSSSNYAVKQTRGKFGLGAKMVRLSRPSALYLPTHARAHSRTLCLCKCNPCPVTRVVL